MTFESLLADLAASAGNVRTAADATSRGSAFPGSQRLIAQRVMGVLGEANLLPADMRTIVHHRYKDERLTSLFGVTEPSDGRKR